MRAWAEVLTTPLFFPVRSRNLDLSGQCAAYSELAEASSGPEEAAAAHLAQLSATLDTVRRNWRQRRRRPNSSHTPHAVCRRDGLCG